MLVVITYDVNTQTLEGQRRLRKVAKYCENYGQRVQNSVFECILDSSQFALVKHGLKKTINSETDSLRFYILGNNYKSKVEHIGNKPSFDIEDILII